MRSRAAIATSGAVSTAGAELRVRLERERFPEEAIEDALAAVTEQGYLNDERYARLTVQDRREIDGWGSERIRARLEAAGVASELIDEALAPIDADAEREAALALIRRRCQLPLSDDRARQRAFGMLIQRGYDMELAYGVIAAVSAAGILGRPEGDLRGLLAGLEPGLGEWGGGGCSFASDVALRGLRLDGGRRVRLSAAGVGGGWVRWGFLDA